MSAYSHANPFLTDELRAELAATAPCPRDGCSRVVEEGSGFCCHACRVADFHGLKGERRGDHSDTCRERRRRGEPSNRLGESHPCSGLNCSAETPLDRKFCCHPCRLYSAAVRRHGLTPAPVVEHGAKCPTHPGQKKVHS